MVRSHSNALCSMNSSVSRHINICLYCTSVSQVVLSALLAVAAARPSGIVAAAAPLALTAPVATAITGTVQYASTPVVTGYTSQVRLCHWTVVPVILKCNVIGARGL
jgi:hypothetical protein